MRKIRILSIDGGGIRGILPGTIISHIEEQLQVQTNNPQARIGEYVDLIAGTSTGGILTCGYLLPDETGKRPRFSAREVANFYFEEGGLIFKNTLIYRLASLFGIILPRFKNAGLMAALQKRFGNARLGDLLKPCVIPSYEIAQRQTVFFNSDDVNRPDAQKPNYYVRDIARATASAPTYFPSSRLHVEGYQEQILIDGGVFANNPALCAYAEVRHSDMRQVLQEDSLPADATVSDMMIVSVGTGAIKEPFPWSRFKQAGALRWIIPLIDILMSGSADTVHFQLRQIFDSQADTEVRANYHRLEPETGAASDNMALATEDNMRKLEQAALDFINKHLEELSEIARKLIAYGPKA